MRKKETEQKNKEMIRKAYKYLFGLTLFFFVSAISGSVIGGFIDSRFGIKPVGTISIMIFFYICTLLIAKKIHSEFTKVDVSSTKKTRSNKKNKKIKLTKKTKEK